MILFISKVFHGVSFINLKFYIRYMFSHVKTFCSVIRKSLYFAYVSTCLIYPRFLILFFFILHSFTAFAP